MKRHLWCSAWALALAAPLLTGCGGGSSGPGAAPPPTLPPGADAAVAVRSLALDQAALAGPAANLADFYTADYHDDAPLTRTTVLEAIQAFLTQFTIISQSSRKSTLKDSGSHVVESWSDTIAVQDKTANNAASTLEEGEIDHWRLDNGVWRIDQAQASPTASVQAQSPPPHGRFR